MVDDNTRASLVMEQINSLRAELLEYAKVVHKAIFAWVSLAGLMAGSLWNAQVVPDDETRALLTLAGAQVQVFLAFLVIAAASNQAVHAGAIASLEMRLNKLCGERLVVWDSEVVPKFLFSPGAAFFWSLTAMAVWLLVNFAFLLYMSSPNMLGGLARLFIGGEVLALVLLVVWQSLETERTRKFTSDAMSKPL